MKRALVLLLILAGCGGTAEVTDVRLALLEVKMIGPEKRRIAERMIVTPLELSGDVLVQGDGLEIDLTGGRKWGDEPIERPAFRVVRDGDDLYVARTVVVPEGPRMAVERYALTGGEPRRCVVGLRPTALHGRSGTCYVGTLGSVCRIPFDRPDPAFTVMYEVPRKLLLAGMKPVDLFAASGDRLIAIDDETAPKFAFAFDTSGAEARYLFTSDLPANRGERFVEAAMSGRQLLLRAAFANKEGRGSRLYVYDVGAAGLERAGMFEEYQDWAVKKALSAWHGIGITAERILVGAGERGVLVLRNPLPPSETGRFFTLGGDCTDLIVVDGGVFALVSEGVGEEARVFIKRIAWDDKLRGLVTTGTFPLSGRPRRFVR